MIPEEVTKLLGKTGEVITMEVEKGAIKRYADAVGDYNPRYWDEEYAKTSKYGSIIAPPGFFGWPTRWTGIQPVFPDIYSGEAKVALIQAGYTRYLYGGTDFEFYRPIRAGDILKGYPKVATIIEREGKSGQLIFVSIETTYTNQNGDVVAKQSHNFVFFC